MLSHLFLGMSLIGAEWVLYFLVFLSVSSIALMIDRARFYSRASRGLEEFRGQIRSLTAQGKWNEAAQLALTRLDGTRDLGPDMESEMVLALLTHEKSSPEVLSEVAADPVMRAKLRWENHLPTLATIGSNAPFVGLFGTVLGIIKAFHDLSQQVGGAQTVTSGISEALVATAVGLLVAIPAVVAFNVFQRRVKAARTEAEALKSFLVGKLSHKGEV